MNQEFYQDLQKRMGSIALFGELFALLKSKGISLGRYGFEELDQQTLLIFTVLRFIMDKTLASESCTLEDVALAILEANRDVFKKELDLDQCRKLADLLVSSVLCNKGEPFSFDPIEGDERWKVRLNYLNSEVITEDGRPKASYRMSDDGFRLMLSTLEMEQNMQLKFRDIIFELQMKAGNYPKALDEIREIFQLLKIQGIEIANRAVQVRANAALLDQESYREINRKTYDLMNESREKLNGYRKNVRGLLEDLNALLQNGQISEEDARNRESLLAISQYLNKSILAGAEIQQALNSFSKLLDEQLEIQLRQSFYTRKPFRQAVWNPIVENPAALEHLDALLHPLFSKAPGKQMVLEHAFAYRSLRKSDLNGAYEEVNNEFNLEAYEKKQEERRQWIAGLNEKVNFLFEKLLSVPHHSMRLSEVFSPDAFDSVDQAREFLSPLASVLSMNLETLFAQRKDIILEEQREFSFSLAALQAIEENPLLQGFRLLKTRKLDTKAEFTIPEDTGFSTIVRTDDLLLELERKPL